MVYLDHVSATPVDPRVLAFAGRFLREEFGNPSTLYTIGLSSRQALEEARAKVAALVRAKNPASIVFTGSATESNNLAVRGTALRNRKDGKKLLVSAIEHISVLNPMKDLQKQGFELDMIPVDQEGVVDQGYIDDHISPDTILVSVNYANDEIGTIEPIPEIARIVHEKGKYLHVNATAAAGLAAIGSGFAVGLAGLSAIGQGMTAASGRGATAQREGAMGPSLIFAVMAETFAIFGLLVAILIMFGIGLFGGG